MKNFPTKTLIWALVAVVGMLIFKEGLMKLIVDTEEFTFFDKFTLKVNKSQAKELEIAVNEYQDQIASLETNIKNQDKQYTNLKKRLKVLGELASDCDELKEEAANLESSVEKSNLENAKILKNFDRLEMSKVVRKNILPQ